MSTRLRFLLTFRLLAACVVCALAVTPVAAGVGRDVGVGGEGELYFVREGTYGELFPDERLADPDNSALALDLVRSDETRERLLVPGTETSHVEDSASILFEDHSGTLFVLWQTKINVIHSRLNLIGLRDGGWTEPIEISGNPFGWKSSPQLAVTRDTFRTLQEDGSLREWSRTVAHLIWWEDGPDVQYSPLTFIDGVYTGWNPVYRLEELDFGDDQMPSASSMNPALAEAPKIESGRNGQSVVIAFVHPSTNAVTSIAVELIPGEIGFIAERIRAQISEIGREFVPRQPEVMAAKVQSEISDSGGRLGLHPGLTSYLADQIYGTVVKADLDEPVGHLAERIRAQISEIGARMTDRGFERLAAKHALQILELPEAPGSGKVPILIRAIRASVRPVPATGTHEATLHLSRSGREVVVSWIEKDIVYYRESRGEGWSGTRPLHLGDGLDLTRAHQILDQRADERSGD